MLRLFAAATVLMMLAAIGLSVGEERVAAYFTDSHSMPHVVSTFFYGLSGR